MLQKAAIGLLLVNFFSWGKSLAQEGAISIVNDTSYNASGGVQTGIASRGLIVADYSFDFTEQHRFFIQFQAQRGKNGSDLTGDIQAFSNIDEDDFTKLYEVWFAGRFSDTNFSYKIGKVDANTEFAYADNAGEFINSSMGFSPTISFLPTYPSPTASLNLFYELNAQSLFKLGLYLDESNEFDSLFAISEWKLGLESETFTFGYWRQSGDIQRLDSPTESIDGAHGFYFVSEGTLSQQYFSSSSAQWFLQLGISDSQTSEIKRHIGLGLVFADVFTLTDHTLGIGITHIATSRFLRKELKASENSIEFFYKVQVNEFLSFKPDLQYIINPAADIDVDNALVLTLRTEFIF